MGESETCFAGSGLGIRDSGLDLIGRQIGVYNILSLLGAGGMGEVYRAHDTKLQRDVAIKALPAAFTADPDRRARFEREARVLASLNHPHIGAIYGFEESNGVCTKSTRSPHTRSPGNLACLETAGRSCSLSMPSRRMCGK